MSKDLLRDTSDSPLPQPDDGTDFQVSGEVKLEVDLLDSAARDATRASSDADKGRGLVILVVDDDDGMRAYVKRCLGGIERGIRRVLEAADGEEALMRVRTTRVDLVISDVVMPRMDGFALCTALRSDEGLRHIPVLLITGVMSTREAQSRARAVQAQGVLRKPFNARELCRCVLQSLEREPDP